LKINIDTTLLQAARQIAPVIRAHNNEAERARRLSKPVLAALTEAGLMRMLTPRSLGGMEVDPLTCARVVEEVAAADSAAGWSLFNPLSWAFISARLPDEGAEELFGRDPHTVIAGPFHPPMQATQVDGGYRLTGRSPFASNCRDATWIASTVMVMDGGQPRVGAGGAAEVMVAYFPADVCEIIDT
jgi:alkylation response protein AidB-like acyl-CoA dehydrogenase